MPRLPTKEALSQARIETSGGMVQGARPIAAQAGAGFGDAAISAGLTGMAIAREQEAKRTNFQATQARATIATEMVKMQSEFENDPDYETVPKRFEERVTALHGEALKGIHNPEQRALIEQQLAVDKQRGISWAQGISRKKETDSARAGLMGVITTGRESALQTQDEAVRATIIQSTNESILAAQEAGYVSAVEAERYRQTFAEDYALGAASMLEAREQVRILGGDTKGTIYDYLPTDKKLDIVRRAKVKVEQEGALTRFDVAERTRDASAAYLQGLTFDNPPSRDEFLTAYGAEEGAKRFGQLENAKKLGNDLSLMATMSPEEITGLLAERDPTDTIVGAGFADSAEQFGVMVKSAQNMIKQREADPAKYVQQYNPSIAALYQGAFEEGTPAAFANYARVAEAEQRRLGVSEVKLLPERQAQEIARQFNQSGGEDAAALIQSLQHSWGKQWPTVYRQLSKELPPAALVIGSGVDPVTAELLGRTANVKTEELKKGLDTTSVTDANRAVNEAFAQFQATLSVQGGESTFATVIDQAKRLAYIHMAQGASVGDATEKAYKALVENKYEMTDTYRVPKEFDFSTVRAGAEDAIKSLDVSNLDIPVPQGLTAEFVGERVQSALRRDGYWVTSEDESGLVLFYSGTMVSDRDGGRIYRSFDELTSTGATSGRIDQERTIRDIRERR